MRLTRPNPALRADVAHAARRPDSGPPVGLKRQCAEPPLHAHS